MTERETEMLAALEEIVKWVRPSGYAPRRYDDAMKMAKAAIEKAKTDEPPIG